MLTVFNLCFQGIWGFFGTVRVSRNISISTLWPRGLERVKKTRGRYGGRGSKVLVPGYLSFGINKSWLGHLGAPYWTRRNMVVVWLSDWRSRGRHYLTSTCVKRSVKCIPDLTLSFLSDQSQISPAPSPEILHHTVWRILVFKLINTERGLCYQFSLPRLYIFFLKCWENVLFYLRTN